MSQFNDNAIAPGSFTGAVPLAVGTLATDSRGILLTTASTGLQVTFRDGSIATITGLNVGTVYPLAIRSITALGGGQGFALL